MGYVEGNTVIVTTEGKNQVAVVLDRRVINKVSVYDVLLESRTALVMMTTNSSNRNYINKLLTAKQIKKVLQNNKKRYCSNLKKVLSKPQR
jgi:hypothetical protein